MMKNRLIKSKTYFKRLIIKVITWKKIHVTSQLKKENLKNKKNMN